MDSRNGRHVIDSDTIGPNRRNGTSIAIVQSNYIPWKGYFDLIRSVDEFVLYDEVQYTRRDWRNRNRIKTSAGLQWLTIPVVVSGRYHQLVSETRIADLAWAEHHWKTLRHSYGRSSAFSELGPVFERFYSTVTSDRLSDINEALIRIVCDAIGIETRLRRSSELDLDERAPTARLVSICRQVGASRYLSGPNARAYMEESQFEEAGIELSWMSYEGYPPYPQLNGPFEHHVSVLDLLFNVGRSAVDYLQPIADRGDRK